MEHFAPVPPAALSRVLSTFNRRQLEGFVAVAIDLMDLADGDPDYEDTGSEDDFLAHRADGPGCPVSDPDGPAWLERLNQSKPHYGADAPADFRNGEDCEEDDPQGEVTEDEPAFDKRSRTIANLRGADGAGCVINGDREYNGDEGDYSA